MMRIFMLAAALFGGLAVAAGAFATHALKDRLSERALEIFETAARYQMYHALALLAVALLLSRAETAQVWLNCSRVWVYGRRADFFGQSLCPEFFGR